MADHDIAPPPWDIDWNRLEPRELDNLCRELLVQMGFQKVEWVEGMREFDLVAELPKQDPDGVEYREVWLISLGWRSQGYRNLELTLEPELLAHRLGQDARRSSLTRHRDGASSPITVLFILAAAPVVNELRDIERKREAQRLPGLRFRLWDRDALATLVQKFPQIGYKYFSDEARAQSKYRKTPDELYQENVALAERLLEETNKRVRAERDAVWKGISFSAAHKMGNPLFTIETYLDPLEKRIHENRAAEAAEVIGKIRASLEKAKSIVDQFKSRTRAQEIHPVAVVLSPLLDEACDRARHKDVFCEVDCPPGLTVQGDPERLSECFDELVGNAMQWLDKPAKRIEVRAQPAEPEPLPSGLDASRAYVTIRFKDNGKGVAFKDKDRIFDAFFTTHDHGTGLGLALVRQIVEGHGGVVSESGVPGEGALFEMYLPAPPVVGEMKRRGRRTSSKK